VSDGDRTRDNWDHNLVRPSEALRRLLTVTGLIEAFGVFSTIEDAADNARADGEASLQRRSGGT
jgi:hypothetical protein